MYPQIAQAMDEMRDHGIPYDAFLAYQAQFHNCKRRGIELRFTLREWWEWWTTNDKWSRRGRGKGGVMMLRVADVGDYAPGNVYAGTQSDNARDHWRRPTEKQLAALKETSRKGGDGLRRHMSKRVAGPRGEFDSVNAAAEAAGVGRDTIGRWARRGTDGWRFV